MTGFKQLMLVAGISASLALASCGGDNGDVAEVNDSPTTENTMEGGGMDAATGATYNADLSKSKVRFIGNGVGKDHPGKFKLKQGTLTVANGMITGGEFVVDMNTLAMEQEGEMISGKLKPHLESDDFMSISQYQTSTFKITSVTPYENNGETKSAVVGANAKVSGDLTLKGQTHNISFPAKVDVDENKVTAKADFIIDRTTWGIVYGNDKSLGDKFISPDVNIELDIEASK